MAETLKELSHNASKVLPAVKLTKLPRSLFRIPPSVEPAALPPPPDHPNLAHPFTIPTGWYNALLHPYVPITIALVYATTVTYLNSVNARRQWKPWAISKTSSFKAVVILHNVILAVYSAWTFVGMANALQLSIPNWRDENGVAGIVDSFCKIQGPRGLGSAATFNEESHAWTMTNQVFHLAADGLGPERSDVGRMWNEGLAFYGWLFYLSKFYEVIDTAIILAKGKKSSFLQTYHHAGAMLCMWAGIRYMSPPIWMFVFVNSGIHALMYTFYFCSALKIHVPKRLKRLLTTMQITQFVVGASFAFLHLFVAYQIPVSVPYLYNVAPKIASMVASDASSAASSVIASATADTGALLKKLALRAAGYEGLAENVGLANPSASAGVEAAIPQEYLAQAEQRYKDELQWVHCLDTSGQVFAILLNCVYLAPLTWLFVNFFIKAYLTQLERRRSSAAADQARMAGLVGDASKDVARRVSEAMIEMHAVGDSSDTDSPIVESTESVGTLKKKAAAAAEKSSEFIRQKATEAAQSAKDNAGKVGQQISEVQHAAQEKASAVADTAKVKTQEAAQAVQEQTPAGTDVKEKAEDVTKKVEEKAPSSEETKSNTEEATNETQEGTKQASETATDEPSTTQEEATAGTEDKSFAEAVKEEPEAKSEEEPTTTSPESPNEGGTGAGEVSGIKTEETEEQEEAKKEQEQIIDESQEVRDDDKDTEAESGADAPKTNGGHQSNIPRPKKKKNKKKA